jgi:hypothetical protein
MVMGRLGYLAAEAVSGPNPTNSIIAVAKMINLLLCIQIFFNIISPTPFMGELGGYYRFVKEKGNSDLSNLKPAIK